MTVKIDVLRKAIAYLREHPYEYSQINLCYKTGGGLFKTCVIGRAALMEGAVVNRYGDIDTFPGDFVGAVDFATKYLGLSDDDFHYIYGGSRTLDEIEARVNEIDARENPAVSDDLVQVKVNGQTFNFSLDEIEAFVLGARAVDPNVRIVKVTEVEL